MAYQLKSNPLENNPLFGGQPQSEPAPEQPENAPKPAKSAKKTARKPSGRGGNKTTPAAESAPSPVPQSAEKSDPEDFVRATFIVRRDLLKLLKDYAYTERREIKDVINEILGEALAKIVEDYTADGRELISRK